MSKGYEVVIRVEGSVWCDFHGCVHDETRDPYGMGQVENGQHDGYECGPLVWRSLWMEEDEA